MTRDNVLPSFASRVLIEVLNNTADSLSEQEATDNWVTIGASDPRYKVIKTVMDKRFGEDRYSYNPSDPKSNKIATSKESFFVHGSVLPAGIPETRGATAQSPHRLLPRRRTSASSVVLPLNEASGRMG